MKQFDVFIRRNTNVKLLQVYVILKTSFVRKTGTVIKKKSSKRKEPNQKRLDTTNKLKTVLKQDSSLSIRKTKVSTTLVFKILHDDLHLKPYKLHNWHKLDDHDYPKRVEFGG
jgi:hypothetical protein